MYTKRTLTDSTHKDLRSKTPLEVITRKKPDLSNLRLFGCIVKVKTPKKYVKGKLGSNTWDGIHVGYEGGSTAF